MMMMECIQTLKPTCSLSFPQCLFRRCSHLTVDPLLPAESSLSPLQLVVPPLGASFVERKQQLTRVSATVDELLFSIVGELI